VRNASLLFGARALLFGLLLLWVALVDRTDVCEGKTRKPSLGTESDRWHARYCGSYHVCLPAPDQARTTIRFPFTYMPTVLPLTLTPPDGLPGLSSLSWNSSDPGIIGGCGGGRWAVWSIDRPDETPLTHAAPQKGVCPRRPPFREPCLVSQGLLTCRNL
jgi:hypothetical protein